MCLHAVCSKSGSHTGRHKNYVLSACWNRNDFIPKITGAFSTQKFWEDFSSHSSSIFSVLLAPYKTSPPYMYNTVLSICSTLKQWEIWALRWPCLSVQRHIGLRYLHFVIFIPFNTIPIFQEFTCFHNIHCMKQFCCFASGSTDLEYGRLFDQIV